MMASRLLMFFRIVRRAACSTTRIHRRFSHVPHRSAPARIAFPPDIPVTSPTSGNLRSEARFGKGPTRFETKRPDQRHVQTWSVIVIETLAHDRLLQNVKRLQCGNHFPRSDLLDGDDPGKKTNLDLSLRAPAGFPRQSGASSRVARERKSGKEKTPNAGKRIRRGPRRFRLCAA